MNNGSYTTDNKPKRQQSKSNAKEVIETCVTNRKGTKTFVV